MFEPPFLYLYELFTKQDAKNNSIYVYLVITYSFYKFRYKKGGSNIAD